MKPQLISWSEALKYTYHSGTLLVDLRDYKAYQEGHITGAWNIPYERLEEHMDEIANYDRVIFYCDHGNHSLKAARDLSRRGIVASSVAGGYEEFRK